MGVEHAEHTEGQWRCIMLMKVLSQFDEYLATVFLSQTGSTLESVMNNVNPKWHPL